MKRVFAIALAALLAAPPLARAEEQQCSLKLISSLDLLENRAGLPIVAVTFNGRPAKMILDTGAYWSGITPSAAAGLKTRELDYIGAVGAGGGTMRTAAKVPQLQIGRLAWHDSDFFVFARDNAEDPDIIGNIGANLLKSYDVEIDYPAHVVKFFLQDHCPGRVVSWHFDELAKIPFSVNKLGHISLPVTLDGHKYRALLDTGATASFLDKKTADRDFGLTAETATALGGSSDTLDGKDLPTFYHRFDTLDLDGLLFHGPQLAFSTGQEEGKRGWQQEEMPSLILGMHQLRKLHLYIAYGEKMLYASVSPEHVPPDAIDMAEVGRLEDKAQAQMAAADYAGAEASLKEAMRAAPDEPSLYANRAYAFIKAGDLTSAMADFDMLVRLDPGSPGPLAGRCTLKIQTDRFDEASADCEQALAIDPRYREALLNRAYLHIRRKEWDLATADCNAVLAQNPQSAPALDYLEQIRQATATPAKASGGKAALAGRQQ
jgi:predicted aspartyl protease/Flp pilus assembly protein TadD